MKPALCLALACVAVTLKAGASRTAGPVVFTSGPASMAVLSVAATDACTDKDARASALAVWVDGRYDHELLLYPGSGRDRYDTLLGPFPPGRHRVDLRPSAFWRPSPCLRTGQTDISVVDADASAYPLLRHAPVLELRADTVGEQTDLPLFEYAEDAIQENVRRLRYTVVFSHEDGGTQTRALLARWGRTTDIEQIYEVSLQGDRAVREEFQGPDHETRPFAGRRRGAAPILLVATLNNMVTDRGRGVAAVRPVPEQVDLSRATRESTLDTRPWAYRVMARELAAEGRIAANAPAGDRWLRQAPDPREHVYLEARLALNGAAVAAWARDRQGRRAWSHYQLESLAIDRDGWVRSAVAIGPDAASNVADLGWVCLPARGKAATPAATAQGPAGQQAHGSCTIEAVRAFVFRDGWMPGPNLVVPGTLHLSAGEEATLRRREE